MSTLDNLRKNAKRWLKALRDGDAEARARLQRAYPDAPDPPTLRDVQHALARERGHENWIALTTSIAASPGAPSDALSSLLDAAGKGDVDRVAAILDAHPDLIDQRGALPANNGLRTALHFGSGHEAIVRLLLERGADPNIRDEGDHAYPIHFAAERGDLSVVKLLVEHGADPSGAGTTHLLDAAGWAVCFDYVNHVDVARYLLAHGAPYTLFTAVALGEADVIRDFARRGVDLNERMDRTNHRRTPLHLAVVKKQPAAVAALIELGADLNAEDAVGLTPLDQAALDGEEAMAAMLIDAGAIVTLPAAIVLERTERFEEIIRANPEALSNNRRWARLLVHASSRGSARVIETLLRTAMRHQAGLTIVNMQDDPETAVDQAHGYTALHAAAFSGNDEAVDVLLRAGANPRVRDSKYRATPAGWARYAGHPNTADRILEADVDLFDAINADRGDRVAQILDADPHAIDRPFKAYATFESKEGQWWPAPACTPLEWARSQNKANALRVLTERGAGRRSPAEIARAERIVSFLQSACWDHHIHGKGDHRMHDRAAQRLLAPDPSIARHDLYTAIVCGDLDEVDRILAARPESAKQRGGARGWTPMLYLAYTRFNHPPTIANAMTIARRLLDAGADPNDFYMAGDSPYTVLVGAAGEGEQDSPRQPYAAELFELLLQRGAKPFAIQVLYNTHFSGDMLWWLDLVYRYTIDTPLGAAWSDPEWKMFDMGGYGSGARFILEFAIKKRKVDLAEWALARGANPNAAPARDRRFPKRSLYELAVDESLPAIATLLARYGATPSARPLDDMERFVDACFRLDRDAARASLAIHPEYLESPNVMFLAAARDRADVLALLLDLGFPLEIQDKTGKRTLHEAAAHGALRAAAFLIERGCEIDPRETIWGGAPIGWAAHGDKQEMVALLSRYSRNIWTLCFNGYVDRVRELLAEDPSLARVTSADGVTPLWWLPDDEAKAMTLVDLFVAAGADPKAKSKDGRTAADWARRRGMFEIAARLDAV